MDAAREVLATFTHDELPTPEEEQELLALWSAPRAKPAPPRARKKTSGARGRR
jgi:hypothetical protein